VRTRTPKATVPRNREHERAEPEAQTGDPPPGRVSRFRPFVGSGLASGEVDTHQRSGAREREADPEGGPQGDPVTGEVRVVRDSESDVLSQDSHDLLRVEQPELASGDVTARHDRQSGN